MRASKPDRHGRRGSARPGVAWFGRARRGMAGQAMAREAGVTWHGQVRRGMARHG
jgi:hypothetical protein